MESCGIQVITFNSSRSDMDVQEDLHNNTVLLVGTAMYLDIRDQIQKKIMMLSPSIMKIDIIMPPEHFTPFWLQLLSILQHMCSIKQD